MKTIPAGFQNDEGWFPARCLDFPVTTKGKSLVATRKHLPEAVELDLETWGDEHPDKPVTEVYLSQLEVAA